MLLGYLHGNSTACCRAYRKPYHEKSAQMHTRAAKQADKPLSRSQGNAGPELKLEEQYCKAYCACCCTHELLCGQGGVQLEYEA
jgi:hypothetical protein